MKDAPDLYRTGLPPRIIAAHLGVALATVYRRLEKAGVPVEPTRRGAKLSAAWPAIVRYLRRHTVREAAGKWSVSPQAIYRRLRNEDG